MERLRLSWRRLLMQPMRRAVSLEDAKEGKSMPARMAMMAMTTSNSTKVNAERAAGATLRRFFFIIQMVQGWRTLGLAFSAVSSSALIMRRTEKQTESCDDYSESLRIFAPID